MNMCGCQEQSMFWISGADSGAAAWRGPARARVNGPMQVMLELLNVGVCSLVLLPWVLALWY